MHNCDIIIDHHLQDKLPYKLDQLCVPKGKRLQLIRGAHASNVVGHFGVGKTMANL